MSEKKKSDEHNPLEDVREGLGLLFRAARTAVGQLPSDKVEQAIAAGVREVGRAIETIGEQVFGKPTGEPTKVAPTKSSAEPPPDATPGTKVRDEGTHS